MGVPGGLEQYQLSHPGVITERGGLRLFTDVNEGDEVVLMAGDRHSMPEVPRRISDTVPDVPFLGIFAFGEQGCMREGENHHGNLMISDVLFGE